MTEVKRLIQISNEAKRENERRENERHENERHENERHETQNQETQIVHSAEHKQKIQTLIQMYSGKIESSLMRTATLGIINSTFVNFRRYDFENIPSDNGKFMHPRNACSEMIQTWIAQNKDKWNGLKYDVWNNGSLSTYFSFGDDEKI